MRHALYRVPQTVNQKIIYHKLVLLPLSRNDMKYNNIGF